MVNWIWLNSETHPDLIKTNYCSFMDQAISDAYCVADFRRSYTFSKPVTEVRLLVSGSSGFRLYANGNLIGSGPANAGGDFLCQQLPPVTYLNAYTAAPENGQLDLYAEVRLKPVELNEYSLGRGGFYLSAEVFYRDGSRDTFGTDGTWQTRVDARFPAPFVYDGTAVSGSWEPAVPFDCDARLETAPIPMLKEETVFPAGCREIAVPAGETVAVRVDFDRIYAGHLLFCATESVDLTVSCYENRVLRGSPETLTLAAGETYRSYQMHSIGGYELRASAKNGRSAILRPALVSTCYPVNAEGTFRCGDETLNTIYDVCKWTLRNCRQMMHLDSPMHQEPLACTGDYYIETLMTAFTFGDMRLARLDTVRTANWLAANDGRMFVASYSLVWVQMVYAVYEFTADTALLREIEPALRLLLRRFHGYLGDNGLLEHAPDYMFVDWTVYQGISMHHPPKALGQTPLVAFYHGALLTAAKIFDILGKADDAALCVSRAASIKKASRELLYDEERGLYFDGLTTPVENTHYYLPENVDIKRFSKYGNTLAVLYGLTDGGDAARIMETVMTDGTLDDVQPYFTHFILEALSVTGLFKKYGIPLIRRWKVMTDDCRKGLKEGWFAPQEDYSFDYSHAWGGTPAYQLPAKLLGFRMIEPGFKKIALDPDPMGLADVEIAIPTPYGEIRCVMKDGETAVTVPDGIETVPSV